MTHGDEQGLVLPPKVAAKQVVLVPVGPWKKKPEIIETLVKIKNDLRDKGIRVILDDSDNSPGYKFNEWELKGVPMRIEFGPRDLKNEQVMLKMRDLSEKESVSLDKLMSYIPEALDSMQSRLLKTARKNREQNEYTDINTLDELKQHIESTKKEGKLPGFVLAGWDGDPETEEKIKEETGFTTRNIPFEAPVKKETCIVTGKPAKHTVWLARAY